MRDAANSVCSTSAGSLASAPIPVYCSGTRGVTSARFGSAANSEGQRPCITDVTVRPTRSFIRWNARSEYAAERFGCSVGDASDLSLSEEHSEYKWVTAEDAAASLPPGHWLSALIARAEAFRKLMPEELRRLHWTGDIEF